MSSIVYRGHSTHTALVVVLMISKDLLSRAVCYSSLSERGIHVPPNAHKWVAARQNCLEAPESVNRRDDL